MKNDFNQNIAKIENRLDDIIDYIASAREIAEKMPQEKGNASEISRVRKKLAELKKLEQAIDTYMGY